MLKKKIISIVGIVLVIATVLFLGKIIKGAFFVYNVASNSDVNIKAKTNGEINVLLLGIGGGTHEAPNLSDTIILVNLQPQNNRAHLISIPRDLWVPELSAKINSAYKTGQDKGGKGIVLAKSAIEKVTRSNIDYVVVVDFSGFIKLVDLLGGIDVDIKRAFDDYAYPIEGKEVDPCGLDEDQIATLSAQIATSSASESDAFPCRYKHIHFDSGVQHMDGQTALELVRSRHALGVEGTDFARSQRQQAVISAIKDKMFSLGTILNPVKLLGVYNILKNNIHTDIPLDQIDDFINLARRMEKSEIVSVVIDTGDLAQKKYGLLINPPISKEFRFAWVLIPRVGGGNFSEIQDYIACIKTGNICVITADGIAQTKNELK